MQALAGLARSGHRVEPFEEATRLFEERQGHNFGPLIGISDDIDLLELSRAAAALGRMELARDLLEKARDHGSTEALTESVPLEG